MVRTARSATVVLALLLVLAVTAGACSSSKKSSGSTTSSTVAPEAIKAPLSEVLTKLPKMVGIGNEVATEAGVGNWSAAKTTDDTIEGVWSTIEGTVKDRDPDAYVSIEDAQARITRGVESKSASDVRTGAQDQATAVAAWVAKHGA